MQGARVTVDFVRPRTLDETFEILGSDEDAHLIAGGVSVVLLMGSGLMEASRLVSLDRVVGLDGIQVAEDRLEIGALSTHQQLATHPLLREYFSAAAEMFTSIGNIRVRLAGTIGGNLAHADPAQDPAVMLTVLGATVVVAGPDGERVVPVIDLADGPLSVALAHEEVITRVHVPLPHAGEVSAYTKFLPGTYDDYATVSVACRLRLGASGDIAEAVLAAGAVGPTVVVLADAAQVLVGRHPDPDVLAELEQRVRESVSPHGDRRGSGDYKRAMTGVIAARTVAKALSGQGQ